MSGNFYRLAAGVIIFILAAGFVDSLSGQPGSGKIEGVVISEEGEPLPAANIYIPGLNRGTVSDNRGEFVFKQLPSGSYLVTVKYIGYEPRSRKVEVRAGETAEVSFKLEQSFIRIQPVVVTGRPVASDPLSSPQDISCLSGREKFRLQSASLGETIENIPGVYNISAGAVAGKPVIRGQTGERIRILSDGIVQEYQQYGERHAPNLDPFNADRIEVIKGAASLLYGSDALGGAVNLISPRFRMASRGEADLRGELTTSYHSNNGEYMAGMKLSGSRDRAGFTGSLVRRSGGNFHTPDVAPFAETGERGDPKFTGEIDHTDFEQINGSFSAGFMNSMGRFSVRYHHYYNKNNFLLPTGDPIGLRLRNQIAATEASLLFGSFILKPRFSYQRNQRQAARPGKSREVLPDSANVDLILDVFTGRLEAEHSSSGGLSGTIGGEIRHYDHENAGLVTLQPTGHFTSYALFGFEEWKKDRLTVDFGARFDYRSQKFYRSEGNPLLPADDRRSYSSLTGALGASCRMSGNITAAVNIGRGFRTPSFYNLYVYGYHGGVFAYQIGNPDLENETSLDISSSLRCRGERVEASFSLFRNRIDNYIFLYNAPDHTHAPEEAGFVFAHDQADAVLTGMDLDIRLKPTDWITLRGYYSLIRSQFSGGTHSGNELPLMPPDRLGTEAKFILPGFSFIHSPDLTFRLKYTGDKSAAGVYEPFGQFDDGIGPDIPFGTASTGEYLLLDIALGLDLEIAGRMVNSAIEVTNLMDEDYRDFLDTYKGYTLSAGRSINFRLNVPLDR